MYGNTWETRHRLATDWQREHSRSKDKIIQSIEKCKKELEDGRRRRIQWEQRQISGKKQYDITRKYPLRANTNLSPTKMEFRRPTYRQLTPTKIVNLPSQKHSTHWPVTAPRQILIEEQLSLDSKDTRNQNYISKTTAFAHLDYSNIEFQSPTCNSTLLQDCTYEEVGKDCTSKMMDTGIGSSLEAPRRINGDRSSKKRDNVQLSRIEQELKDIYSGKFKIERVK